MTTTQARLRDALSASPYRWLALASPANVGYATGYRSVAGDIFGSHRMLALVSEERTLLVGGASDGAAAMESSVAPDDYVPFGTFYFESADGTAAESRLGDRHPSFPEAVAAAVGAVDPGGTIGYDREAADLVAMLRTADPVDATEWIHGVRSVKLASEIALLREAARLAEAGIDAAVGAAAPGVTEQDLANVVASTMALGGGDPRFTVVTSGPRSALSDARPTGRALEPGDLLRFDVGCTVDGYWSDIGRTVVVGEPDGLQSRRYDAILAGEGEQLAAVAPGITAEELFDLAVSTVEAAGIRPYRRHHCGHAIGREVYERPVIAPGWSTPLQPGMVFCLETPFYEIGWGGMMVEDAVVVTESGVEVLTTSDRTLRVIPA